MISSLMLNILSSNEVADTNLFPFPFPLHLGFTIVAFIFFAYRFITDRKLFQLIFAVAIPLSLLLWVSPSRTLFYAVGAAELVLVAIAGVSSVLSKGSSKEKDEKKPSEEK